MVIRGKIEQGEEISLTCCSVQQDVNIGGKSLYDILSREFNLDPDIDFNGGDQEERDIFVSYLILDEDPGDKNYESIVGEFIVKKLYSSYIGGCYSEYTCGTGDYNYFMGDEGHNIFNELLSYENKYILLNIKNRREVLIDDIVGE
jgi:hypothetical protein